MLYQFCYVVMLFLLNLLYLNFFVMMSRAIFILRLIPMFPPLVGV
ncbi:hypothetical protein HanPSC8_Chr14g0615171 [Helianthus annuus]|nr:hypothetical protein HanPSC8_Chr14g0615171 [Helianthus annuus]